MKSTLRSRRTALILAGSVEALIVALTFNSTAIAASQIWTGTTDGTWATGANWGGSAPGATTGVISGDTATFNINANTAVAVDANRNIKNITFDTGAGAFTLSGGPLVLTNAGAITINSGVTNIETINTNILLSSTASSTYSFINNSFTVGANLVIGGSVTGQTTATAETLTLGGSNNGSVTGVIGNGSAGGTVALTKTGTGTWTLSNANTYTGNTTASGGTLKLDFTAAGAPATNIVSSSSVLKLGGGTLQIVGASGGSTQTFASTSFTAATGGLSVISAAPVTGTIPVVNLGTLTGTQGALVRFDGAAYNSGASSGTTLGGTTVAATATFNATTQTTTSGLISTNNGSGSTSSGGANAYATVGLYDWAAMSAGTAGAATGTSIVGGSQVSGFYTVGASLPLGGTGQNIDLTGSATFGANSTSTSSAYATIRVNAAAAITMTTGRALSENIVGGILITPNVGANNTSLVEQSGTNAQAFQASRGTTGATGVTIWQNNTLGEFIISSVYNNGTNSAATATYTQGGPGTVFLTPSIGGVASINGYTGQTYLDGGTTVINAFSGFGGGAAPRLWQQ